MKKNEKKAKPSFNTGDQQGKHQKAKQNFLNTKRQKGNKGNTRWENFDNDF